MDNFFFVLMVILFIVAPILEKLTKGNRPQQKPPPGRRGQPAQRRRLPDGRTTTVGRPAETAGQATGDASDLLPADLWKILTGQMPQQSSEPTTAEAETTAVPARRPEERPRDRAGQRKPGTRSPRDRQSARRLQKSDRDEEQAAAELLLRRERDRLRRSRLERSPSRVVSLETEPEAEPARHASFHEKLDRLSAPAVVAKRKTGILLDLDDRSSLQRAILLQEVLGKPRGLED